MSGSAQFAVMTKKAERAEYTVCIDSGHGGNDPGKIGVAGTKEKEVNLTIALKLKKHLERQNIRVIMTRTDDRNLADANATNEKISDMKQRVAKMNSEQPDAVISIHQNSYTDSSVKGAQVFYYEGSKEGKMLAELLQKSLIGNVDPQNHRVAKANSDYYILKNTSAPTVIVECGLENYRVDPSQGTHFFQNLTSFGVGYFTVNPFKGDGWFDEAFLNAQPAVEETEYLRHVHFDAPITIKMDGKKSLGVVLKP